MNSVKVDYDPNQPAIPGMEGLKPEPPEYVEVAVRPHSRRIKVRRPKTVAELPKATRARRTDPTTSHQVAMRRTQEGTLTRYQAVVLWTFQENFREWMASPDSWAEGLIDHDLYGRALTLGIRFSEQGLRTARRALYEVGLLEKTGTTRKTPYNHPAEVYRLTRQGATILVERPEPERRTDGR